MIYFYIELGCTVIFQYKKDNFKTSSISKNDSVAQLVEQYTFNVWVLGSNPSGITESASKGAFFVYNDLIISHFFKKAVHSESRYLVTI